MSQSLCPSCGEPLPTANINIAQGVALCPACGSLSPLSTVVEQLRPMQETLAEPPRGCTVTESGDEMRIRASLRSVGGAVGALAVALFWNGIVSIFVLLAAAAIYVNLVGPLPAWFPVPKSDTGAPMSLGMALFLCVFLIPFVSIGAVLLAAVFLCIGGHVEVILREGNGEREGEGVVSTGVGRLCWRRRFDPARVSRVGMGETSWKENDKAKPVIVIEADRKVKFGSMLANERQAWLRAVLHVLLVTKEPKLRELIRADRGDTFRHDALS